MNRLVYAAGLAVIWVLAWGTASPANILGGLAVAAFLIAVTPARRRNSRGGRVRPVAVARLFGHLLTQVVASNVVITREILAPRSRMHTGVVAVALPDCSDGLLTFITNVLALTPGTMPLEVTQSPTVIYVHVLALRDIETARSQVQHLAALAYRAFGSDRAVAALRAVEGSAGARGEDQG